MARNSKLDELRDYITKRMVEEQDRHAKLLADLNSQLGSSLRSNVSDTLSKIHEARMKTLEDMLEKIKEMQWK